MIKKKIVNDPIYGFITIPDGILFELIEHPWFQRMRRIQQLGITYLVYPGATHTRFQHTLGAMHLMDKAIQTLRSKDIEITAEEAESAKIAILLHDIGHGPFSHTLEHSIVHHVTHEDISSLLMQRLNKEFGGKLELSIKIFSNRYHKKFLHQLVSSQLDVDRLDYLTRDTFFTGVSEGVVGYDRILSMLTVWKGNLAVEAKGIYSIEKFIIARRLMYWQVYLHKTVLSAMELLVNIMKRAKEIAIGGADLFCTPAFRVFLYNNFTKVDFETKSELLNTFAKLDDSDIVSSIKVWMNHEDIILSTLCRWLMNRRLYKIKLQNEPIDKKFIRQQKDKTAKKYKLAANEVNYFAFEGDVINDIYSSKELRINMLFSDNRLVDITKASDHLNASVLDKKTTKHFFCYPKEL